MGECGRLWTLLAAIRGGYQSELAAILRPRSLGLYRLRVVLDVGLFLGLGPFPLWPMVLSRQSGLVLGAGQSVGSVLGLLAVFE